MVGMNPDNTVARHDGGPVRVLLASRSPRRRRLLDAHGIQHVVVTSPVDDSELSPGLASPTEWVMSLAFLKASSVETVHLHAGDAESCVVLGADTVCVLDGQVLGQPTDARHARAMLLAFEDRTHEVITGVALWCPRTLRRHIFYDRAVVTWAAVGVERIEAYVASDGWRGKAGAYNLSERVDDGWPITCQGDPGTVMGLPMEILRARIAAFVGGTP